VYLLYIKLKILLFKEEETQVKRIKASVLAAVLAVLTVVGGVFGLSNVTVKAADPLTVSVETVEAKAGQKGVQVAVNVQNPGDLGGLQLGVTFDQNVLKATGAVAGDFKLADPVVNTERMAEGFIGYADASATGKDVSGKVMIITFDVLDSAKPILNAINVNVISAAKGSDASAIKDFKAVNGGIKVACEHKNVKEEDAVVTKAPTFSEEGIKEATCPDCNEKVQFTIPKLEQEVKPDTNTDTVKVEVSAPSTVVGDDVFTEQELKDMADKNVKPEVNVAVNEVKEDQVPADDASKIKGNKEFSNVGAYIDISLSVKIPGVDGSEKKVTQTVAALTFTVSIPENLLTVPDGYVREYKIARVHNGVLELLDTTKSGNNLTFNSDKFSTFAIVYSDKVKTEEPSGDDKQDPTTPSQDATTSGSDTKAPQTGDSLPIALFVLMFVGIAGIVVASKKRRA